MYEIYWEDDDGTLYFYKDKENIYWAHALVYKWSKSVLMKAKAIWLEAMEEFAQKGIEFVCVCIPSDDKKLEKFEKMFGFEEVVSKDFPSEYKLMYCETEVQHGI